jgi:hypothetical protein
VRISIFQDISRCTGKDCCQVLGFVCSVGIRAHWKHCVCNSGGTLLFLYHLYHHYMYHQRLEAFCATDPTSISTTQSPKSFGKDLHPKSNTSRTPPTFTSAVATMEVQQKEYILSVSGRPLLPFPTTPCPSVDVLRFPSYDD